MEATTLTESIKSANSIYDSLVFCSNMYQFLLEQPEDERPKKLAWFFEICQEQYSYDLGDKALYSEKIYDYESKYIKFTTGLIDALSVMGYNESIYYQKLFDCIDGFLCDATLEEKGFCLLIILYDRRTPYYYLPATFDLSDLSTEAFGKIMEEIKPQLRLLRYLFALPKSKKNTYLTSNAVCIMEDLVSNEQKAVFLYWLLRLEKQSEDRLNADNSGQSKNNKEGQADLKAREKDNSFVPDTLEWAVDPDSIITEFEYPNLNGDEYSFVLFKEGENIFLSDRGKTLKQLDKIFELSEPDVIKNLKAILQQYGAIKQENAILIGIDNWTGNIKEEENEDLRKAKLALFSCVSFMLNMKIFYV
ncbi:MAG: hypothetical protein FWG91_00240 [Lachnospiraceae bacterium]|nr:hypothetical protein [Lachnospiraceae bacterium]